MGTIQKALGDMSQVDTILASIGVGAAMLSIRLPKEKYPRGSEVAGFIVLEGGLVEQHIKSITIKMEEFHHAGWTLSTAARSRIVLATEVTVPPHRKCSYPFKFRIPDDARLTERSGAAGWRLQAEADIDWAVNPKAYVSLEIVAHPEVTAVLEAMRLLGFVDTTSIMKLIMRETPEEIITTFSAPNSVRHLIEGVSLHLWVQGPWVNGNMIFLRRQNIVTQHIQGLIGRGGESITLSIPRAGLYISEGHVRARRAIPYLARLLKQALTLSDTEQQTLLRASSKPPEQEDNLLHPVDGTAGETDPDRLLRPTEEDNA